MKLKKIKKPCKSPNQKPGGSYASGVGWRAQPLSTATAEHMSTKHTTRKAPARDRERIAKHSDPKFSPKGLLALRSSRGDGGIRCLLRAGRAFLWRHGFKGTLPADLSANPSTLRALFAEVFQNFGWKLLLCHEPILNRLLAESNISLYLIPGLRYN
jgi:hypothetical protein